MSRELLLIIDAVANEKAVPRPVIVEALEAALAASTRKQFNPEDARVRIQIDPKSGEVAAWRRWEVIADDGVMLDPAFQVRLMDALDDNSEAEVGDWLEEAIDPPKLGRISAQTAKQVMLQRVREAERGLLREAWENRIGEMVTATVKRVDRGQVVLDLGQTEGTIPRKNQIPNERLKIGHRVRCVLVEITDQNKGSPLIFSRTDPRLMIELFKVEVPEIGQGVIEIKDCARDPGARGKISVYSYDKRLDPIGACIGMRGSRVQVITNELNGERVDIILWNENQAQYVISAMAPAEIESIVINEDQHSMDVAVPQDKLALAIGRGGQNIRLASKLTGWTLAVMSQEELQAKQDQERNDQRQLFLDKLEVDEEISDILINNGFTTLEEVAYVPLGELLAVEEFDEDIVEELRSRALDALINQEIQSESDSPDDEELRNLEGMTSSIFQQLKDRGITNRESLADLAADEILDIDGMNDDLAKTLIMEARKPWFV